MTSDIDKPILIDLEANEDEPSPAEAPMIEETGFAPTGQAMQTVAALTARKRSPLVGWFWRLLFSVFLFFSGVAAWDTLNGLVARNPLLGGIATGLLVLLLLVCAALVFREFAALSRLSRMDKFQARAAAIRDDNDLAQAKDFANQVTRFYSGRDELKWARANLGDALENAFDADTVFMAVEDNVLAPLDAAATREIELAARQVAIATALVPLALADVVVALTANLRMIRRISELYGGRSGTLGNWRLTRAVFTHLVATGAVAVGDDLLGSLGGGHLMARISKRFGEGLVNGALTARVGVAAMEVCRPLPFAASTKPSVTGIVRRAVTGVFEKTN